MNQRPTWIFSLSKILTAVLLAFVMALPMAVSAQDEEESIFTGGDLDNGETLFNNNCASCHRPTDEVLAAPGLAGIEDSWGDKEDLLVQWIQDPNEANATGDPYVTSMVEQYVPTFGWMQPQPVNRDEIRDILTWITEGDHGEVDAGTGEAGTDYYVWDEDWGTEKDEDSSLAAWFLVLGIIFLIIALSAAGVRRQLLTYIQREKTGVEPESESYMARFKTWAWKNKVMVSLVGLFITVFILVLAYQAAMDIAVPTGYRPSQPIKFSHKLHAGKNEIDCQYCHHSAAKSKHAGIPSANVCMNCHAGIREGHNDEFTGEIQKIYDAIGYDPSTGTYIEGYEQKPIKWVKVHNLPDFSFFSHKQHVEVGNLECQNCHGPVETFTEGRVSPVSLNNTTEGAIQLTKETMTMGWCIECHNTARVQVTETDNGYYEEIHERLKNSDRGREELRKYLEDEKITVRELGGWECAKCHY